MCTFYWADETKISLVIRFGEVAKRIRLSNSDPASKRFSHEEEEYTGF